MQRVRRASHHWSSGRLVAARTVAALAALAPTAASVAQSLIPASADSARPIETTLKRASPVRQIDPVVGGTGTAAAGVLHERLVVVEAGSEDVGPMSTTLRDDPFDMRVPTAFSRVYRVPGSDDLLMRGNGALFVVFDESVYRRTRQGSSPVIGDGAKFHIGIPGGLRLAPEIAAEEKATFAEEAARRNGRIDRRIDGSVRVQGLAEQAGVPGMIDRESLRRRPVPADRGSAPRTSVPRPPKPSVTISESDPYAHLRLGPARIER